MLPFPDPNPATPGMVLRRLISGGQTGVDRAALDAARAAGLPHGGWCPLGRRAEDGVLSDDYLLQETPEPTYPQRTEWNVRDSDATLILYRERIMGGTLLTRRLAKRFSRPCLCIDLAKPRNLEVIMDWLMHQRIETLNVAGPRESTLPGVYDEALGLMTDVLVRLKPRRR